MEDEYTIFRTSFLLFLVGVNIGAIALLAYFLAASNEHRVHRQCGLWFPFVGIIGAIFCHDQLALKGDSHT